METVFISAAVVGFVELLRRLQHKDYFDALTILGATIIGAVAGALNAPGVPDVWTGIVLALAASGSVTVASKIGTTSGTK